MGRTRNCYKFLAAALLPLAFTSARCGEGAIEEIKNTAEQLSAELETGANESVLTLADSREGKTAEAYPEENVSLNSVLPVIKRRANESDGAYKARALSIIGNVLKAIVRVSGKITCTEDKDFLRRGYIRLAWEYGDWEYTALTHVPMNMPVDMPVAVHNITMTPLNGDKTKMPETKEEFLRLVNELTFLRVEDAKEGTDNGRPDFLSPLDDKYGEAVLDSSFISTDYGPIAECGSIVLTWPNSAKLKYFVKS